MARVSKALLVSGLLALGSARGQAQQRADLLAWGVPAVRLQPDSSRWALDGTYYYAAYQHLTRTFLQLGTAGLSYTRPQSRLSLGLTYTYGALDGLARVQVGQVQLAQAVPTRHWLRPRWRLTLDGVWFIPEVYEGHLRHPIYRVRTLVGIELRLTPRLNLVLNTEPFVYRTKSSFQEVRTQAGLQVCPTPRLTVQALYWNRWRGYPGRPVTWEHAVMLTTLFIIKGPRLAPALRHER